MYAGARATVLMPASRSFLAASAIGNVRRRYWTFLRALPRLWVRLSRLTYGTLAVALRTAGTPVGRNACPEPGGARAGGGIPERNLPTLRSAVAATVEASGT